MLKTFVEQSDECTSLKGQPWPECRACLYWAADNDQERTGECRRYVPDAEHGWPCTTAGGWCGEWAQFK